MNKATPLSPHGPLIADSFVAAAATNDNMRASGNKKFIRHFDKLLSEVWFSTEAESITPENVEKTKRAFQKFFKNMDWPIAAFSYEALLQEKTGEFEFRADGKTPNWYHEFRECLWALNFIRKGLIPEKDLNKFGGAEALVAVILRHDSWEDLGNSANSIVEKLQAHAKTFSYSKSRIERLDEKSDAVGLGVNLLTRKIPVLDENGNFVRKSNGKIKKEDRFGSDVNLYYQAVLQNPLSAFAKPLDGIEGMATRVGVLSYSVHDDVKYTEERRMLYGSEAKNFEGEAIKRYAFLKDAIECADDMLGVTLVMLETLNHYAPDSAFNPKDAKPMDIEKYEKASRGFEGIPAGFHPVHIKMERMWAKAARENDGRVDAIISNAFLPALVEKFPNLTTYSKSRPASALPKGGVYAPNMG